jgi:hypothetical protein
MGDEPTNDLERVIDAALDVIEEHLRVLGVAKDGYTALVTVHVEDRSPPNSATGAWGYEQNTAMVAELLGMASGLAKQVGLDVRVVPMEPGQG